MDRFFGETLIARLDPILEAVRLLVALLPAVGWPLAAALLAVGTLVAGLSGLDVRSESPAHFEDPRSRMPREAADVCATEPTDGQLCCSWLSSYPVACWRS